MPRPVCITYDSTCDLTPQLLERFQIRTIPLTIQSGERVFPDDGQYTSAELYAEYRRNGTLPKTAAVSPEDFKAFFAPILAEGYDIVHIDISSELSCTCQNAVLAAQELAEQGQIHVVDGTAAWQRRISRQNCAAWPLTATPASCWTRWSTCGRAAGAAAWQHWAPTC